MGELFGFLFAELAEGRPVEVLRVGEFVDRNGRPVAITDEDLDVFVANFEAGTAGQDVPIDVGHEKAEAAGWIQALTRVGDRLVAVPDWNEVGKRLVGDKVYKYLSATIDMALKTIRSISLVNFPAVKGLRPVELGEGAWALSRMGLYERVVAAVMAVFEGEGEEEEEARGEGDEGTGNDESLEDQDLDLEEGQMSDEERAKLREEIRQEMEVELAERAAATTELREQVRAEVEVELAATFERRQGFVAFAAEVCGGDVGLAEKPEDVVVFLESLPADQVELAQRMLRAKVVEFGERGSTGAGNDRKELDGPYAVQLRTWVQKGNSVSEFFELNEDILGKADLYDLSAFENTDS